MRFWLIIAMGAFALSFVGCGGSAPDPGNELGLEVVDVQEKSVPLPSWYITPPQDETNHYERAEATAKHMEDAEEQARLNAAGRIAAWIRSRVEAKSTRTRKILGEDGTLHAAYDRVVEQLTSESITGLEPSPGHLDARVTEEGRYHVYVLMRIPRDQAFNILDKALSQEEELYEAFIRDNLIEEFKSEIADYKAELKGGN